MATGDFLITGTGTPATVDETGPWKTILQNESLTVVPAPENNNNDISIAAPLDIPSGGTWIFNFSSTRNAGAFGPDGDLPNNIPHNNVWLGDQLQCSSPESRG